MTDKDVQRNVRSSSEEGIKTPTEKHYHTLSEKGNIPLGESIARKREKEELLAKFRMREEKWRTEEKKLSEEKEGK